MPERYNTILQNPQRNDTIQDGKALTDKDISAINKALAAKLRVEIVSTASGIKIYNVKRKELNT